MKTIRIKAKKLNGQRGYYVKTGKATFEFEGVVTYYENEVRHKERYIFEVSGVKANGKKTDDILEQARYAIDMVDYMYSANLDILSIKNVKRINKCKWKLFGNKANNALK